MNDPVGTSRAGGDLVSRLGFAMDQAVQEVGWDTDVDDAFRGDVEVAVGAALEDEDYSGVTDAVVLWWREEDGDLADGLVDVLSTLEDDGFIVLLTPRTGRPGEVSVSDVEEATRVTGLHANGAVAVGPDWNAARLSPSRGPRR